MNDITSPTPPEEQSSYLIFHKHRDELTWGYACPFGVGETPTEAFLRVLDHIIDALPDFARPDYFGITDEHGNDSDLRDFPDETTAWQKIVRSAIPGSPRLEASLGLVLVLQASDGQQGAQLSGNSVSVAHVGSMDPAAPAASTINVHLAVYFDVYDPVPPNADDRLLKQAGYNRPRLERFLKSIRDDLNGDFVYRDYPQVGPLGVLDEGASQEGLPPY